MVARGFLWVLGGVLWVLGGPGGSYGCRGVALKLKGWGALCGCFLGNGRGSCAWGGWEEDAKGCSVQGSP